MPKTVQQHLSNERQQRINRAWKYLTPWQRMVLLTKVIWWALPNLVNVVDIVESIQSRMNAQLTYFLFPAHWVNK